MKIFLNGTYHFNCRFKMYFELYLKGYCPRRGPLHGLSTTQPTTSKACGIVGFFSDVRAGRIGLYIFYNFFPDSRAGRVGLYVFFRILGPDGLGCMFSFPDSRAGRVGLYIFCPRRGPLCGWVFCCTPQILLGFPLYAKNYIRISVVRHKFQ